MSRSVDTYGVFADSSVTPFRGPMMRADAMNTTPLRTPSTQPGSRDDGDVGSGETWPELYADTGRFKPARSLQFRNVDGSLDSNAQQAVRAKRRTHGETAAVARSTTGDKHHPHTDRIGPITHSAAAKIHRVTSPRGFLPQGFSDACPLNPRAGQQRMRLRAGIGQPLMIADVAPAGTHRRFTTHSRRTGAGP